MFRKLLFLVIILLVSSLFVSAQDTTEIDPEANACNEGGSMEGKCNIDFDENGTVDDYEILWAWTCGWYIARYDAGIFAEVPSYCQSLLASEPIEIVEGDDGEGTEPLYCYTGPYLEEPPYWNIYEILDGGELKFIENVFSEPDYPQCAK
jgi:hypothetical protein